MSRTASVTAPGSLLWFARFEARLAWRDVVAMMTAGRTGRARTLAFGFGTLLIFLHVVAYLVLHFVSDGSAPTCLLSSSSLQESCWRGPQCLRRRWKPSPAFSTCARISS